MTDLGQGFPDFSGSAAARDAACAAIQGADFMNNQYSAVPGVLRLREALAGYYQRIHGVSYDPNSEVCVTCSGT